jgi:hypothetical protein
MTRATYYWCKKRRKLIEGYPPNPNNYFGDAPCVIFDSMPPEYHEAGRMTVDSRKTWKLLDKMHGTITFSPHENYTPPDETLAEKRKRRDDIREARRKAVAQVKAGTHPLTDDQKQLCRQADERISHQLGYDVSKIWKPTKKTRKK